MLLVFDVAYVAIYLSRCLNGFKIVCSRSIVGIFDGCLFSRGSCSPLLVEKQKNIMFVRFVIMQESSVHFKSGCCWMKDVNALVCGCQIKLHKLTRDFVNSRPDIETFFDNQ